MIKCSAIPANPCAWARWLVRTGDFVVWDTETTGLEDDARIVSIGIVDQDGQVLVDTMIDPGISIPPASTAIHGITDEMVHGAPTFARMYPLIRRALINRRWVIYNARFDVARLQYECEMAAELCPPPAQMLYEARIGCFLHDDVHCAMEHYAVHHGAWNEYHESYTWQKLTTAAEEMGVKSNIAHNALHDALTTLRVIQRLALHEDRVERNE